MWDRLIFVPNLWTGGTDARHISNAALGIAAGRIVYLGRANDLLGEPWQLATQVEYRNELLTPSLVDCHTHLVFGGDRSDEFAERQAGASYAEIAARGGGILATVRATRASSVEQLVEQAAPRMRQLIADGVAAFDIKSGYGLDFDSERRMLQAARALGERLGATVRTSYLALHAVPKDVDRKGYLDSAIDAWLPQLHTEGLIDAVDAYHEHLAFDSAEVERLFARATALGIPVRLHADQLSAQGGAALATQFGALSADHLEYTDSVGVAAMARSGTVAVILPAAFLVLREKQRPPIAALRAAGVPMAVASDLNPGTSPMLSLRLAMGLAVSLFGMTVEEVLLGATKHGARALGLEANSGTLVLGARADLALWSVDRAEALPYWLGGELCVETIAGGRTIFRRA